MKRVACLARVSTMDQHSSIDNQHELFNNWLEKNEDCILYKNYTDEGVSGAKGYKRKQWLQMLVDGKNKKFDILLAKSYSRFGRNQRETLEAISQLRENNIRIIFLEDGLDSEKDANQFGLFAWLAEQEAQKTSERIKTVWINYDKIGKIHACIPAYGYNYNVNLKNFEINYEESLVVKKIFNLYLKGLGCARIANILNSNKCKTKRGGKWGAQTIKGILINPVYIGTLVQGKTKTLDVTSDKIQSVDKEKWIYHYNNHKAIIDKEVFNKVQLEYKLRSNKVINSYLNGGKRYSDKSLFSNLIRCGECGSTMSIKRKKSVKSYKPHYKCSEYERIGLKCGHTANYIWEDVLINYIKRKLDKLVKNDYKKLREILKKQSKDYENESISEELSQINKQIDINIEMSNNLLKVFSEGIIKRKQYILQNEEISKKLDFLLLRKTELENVLNRNNDPKKQEKELIGGINELLGTPIEKWNNAMMRAIIEKILIYKDGTVNIKFKYLNNYCNK